MEFLSTPDLCANTRWCRLLTPSSTPHPSAGLPDKASASAPTPTVDGSSANGGTPFPSVNLGTLPILVPTPAPSDKHKSNPSPMGNRHQSDPENCPVPTTATKQAKKSDQSHQQQSAAFSAPFLTTASPTSPSPTTVPPLDRAGIKNSFQSLFSPTPVGGMVPPTPNSADQFPSPNPLQQPHHAHQPYPPTPGVGGSSIGLTPFIQQGGVTPSLFPSSTNFFAPDGRASVPGTTPTPHGPQSQGGGDVPMLNSPYLHLAAKEAVRREFLNMPTFVTYQKQQARLSATPVVQGVNQNQLQSPSTSDNPISSDNGDCSPGSVGSKKQVSRKRPRQEDEEEENDEDMSEDHAVPKPSGNNDDLNENDPRSTRHRTSVSTSVCDIEAVPCKSSKSSSPSAKSNDNRSTCSSHGDAKVPTSASTHDVQPMATISSDKSPQHVQPQQLPLKQAQMAAPAPFHTYFMPHPHHPHGMMLMGPHGPMSMHPQAGYQGAPPPPGMVQHPHHSHPHAALYAPHPSGMMMFPGGQHVMPYHAHAPHPHAAHSQALQHSYPYAQVQPHYHHQQQQPGVQFPNYNAGLEQQQQIQQQQQRQRQAAVESNAVTENGTVPVSTKISDHLPENIDVPQPVSSMEHEEVKGSEEKTTGEEAGTGKGNSSVSGCPSTTRNITPTPGSSTTSGLDINGCAGGSTSTETANINKQESQADKKARVEVEKQELIREFKKKTREAALVRFRQKRSERRFGKLIRYDCRKKLADARPRVKGRFVRIKTDEFGAEIEEESESVQVVPGMVHG